MELRFDAMLCSNLGNENSYVGHIKCSDGRQVPRHWYKTTCLTVISSHCLVASPAKDVWGQ